MIDWSDAMPDVRITLTLPSRQHTVEIGIRRRHVIEARVEVARQRADVFLEMIGIENLRQPR